MSSGSVDLYRPDPFRPEHEMVFLRTSWEVASRFNLISVASKLARTAQFLYFSRPCLLYRFGVEYPFEILEWRALNSALNRRLGKEPQYLYQRPKMAPLGDPQVAPSSDPRTTSLIDPLQAPKRDP